MEGHPVLWVPRPAEKQRQSTHQLEGLTQVKELKPQVFDSFTTGKDIRLTFTILSELLCKNVDSGIQHFYPRSTEPKFQGLREACTFEFKHTSHIILLHIKLADLCVLVFLFPPPLLLPSILIFPLPYLLPRELAFIKLE